MRGLLILLGVAIIVIATFVLLTRKRSGKKKGVTNATDEPFKMPKSMLGWFPYIIYPLIFGFVATVWFMYFKDLPLGEMWNKYWFWVLLIAAIGLFYIVFKEQIPKKDGGKKDDKKDAKKKDDSPSGVWLTKEWAALAFWGIMITLGLTVFNHTIESFHSESNPYALAATMPAELEPGWNKMLSKKQMSIIMTPTQTFLPDTGKTIMLRFEKGPYHYDYKITRNLDGSLSKPEFQDNTWTVPYEGLCTVMLLGYDDYVTYAK